MKVIQNQRRVQQEELEQNFLLSVDRSSYGRRATVRM